MCSECDFNKHQKKYEYLVCLKCGHKEKIPEKHAHEWICPCETKARLSADKNGDFRQL